jgi:uncharacterized membrane protein HdeD (DUF308 family)
MTKAEAAKEQVGTGLLPHKNWIWFVVRGVLALILGTLAILFPEGALFAFAMLVAAFLFVDGALSVASGFSGAAGKQERWWTLMLRGLAGLVVALLFVLMPFVSAVSYALATLVLLAAWSIGAGVLEIAAAIRLRKEMEREWLLGLSGALSVLLGVGVIVLFAINPLASILSVAWMIGLYALIAGVVLIVQGVRLRKRQKTDGEKAAAPAATPQAA